MELANKVLWTIERNLLGTLDLGTLAAASGVSNYHLAHAFTAATGMSVMHYVRGRRPTEAAKKLAAGAPYILDLALDSGYASHKAFTRAFRAQFGVTPEQMRGGAPLPRTAAVEPLPHLAADGIAVAAPRFATGGIMPIVGLAAHYDRDAALLLKLLLILKVAFTY